MPVKIDNPVTDAQCAEIYKIGKAAAEPPPTNGGGTKTITQDWLDPTNPMYPTYAPGETLVVKIPIPENAIWGPFLVSWGQHNGPPIHQTVSLSAFPNDFRPVDKTGANGPFVMSGGPTGGIGDKLSDQPPLKAGGTFYASFKSVFEDPPKSGNWVSSVPDGVTQVKLILGWTFPK